MGRWSLLALCLAACGRSDLIFVGGLGGTVGSTSVAADAGPGGEVGPDGEVDGDLDGDDDPTGVDACQQRPDVRWARLYDGEALQTVARDLERRPGDATLYMAGTSADADSMYLWIAAAAPDGSILWEVNRNAQVGQNLAGWTPEANDIALLENSLSYVGSTYVDAPMSIIGSIELGSLAVVESPPESGGVWFGQAGGDPFERFVVGRDYSRTEGSRVELRFDLQTIWSVSTAEANPARDKALTALLLDERLIVAGQLGDYAWIAGYEAFSGQPLWSQQVVETATFEARSGGLRAIGVSAGNVIAAGDIYINKPDPVDGSGSYSFTEAYVGAWTPEGQPVWSWQRGAEVIRSGMIQSLAVGPDGTIFVSGEENEFGDDARLFVAAFSPDGELLWTLQDGAPSFDTAGYDGMAIVVGGEGQLYVLSNKNLETGRTTALFEICY